MEKRWQMRSAIDKIKTDVQLTARRDTTVPTEITGKQDTTKDIGVKTETHSHGSADYVQHQSIGVILIYKKKTSGFLRRSTVKLLGFRWLNIIVVPYSNTTLG